MQLQAWLAGSAEECRSWKLRVRVQPQGEASGADPSGHSTARYIPFRSLSVDAPDCRRHVAVGEPVGEGEGEAAQDGGDDWTLRLPPHAGRVELDFVADPVDSRSALARGANGKVSAAGKRAGSGDAPFPCWTACSAPDAAILGESLVSSLRAAARDATAKETWR